MYSLIHYHLTKGLVFTNLDNNKDFSLFVKSSKYKIYLSKTNKHVFGYKKKNFYHAIRDCFLTSDLRNQLFKRYLKEVGHYKVFQVEHRKAFGQSTESMFQANVWFTSPLFLENWMLEAIKTHMMEYYIYIRKI